MKLIQLALVFSNPLNNFVLSQASRIIELKDGAIINDKQRDAA